MVKAGFIQDSCPRVQPFCWPFRRKKNIPFWRKPHTKTGLGKFSCGGAFSPACRVRFLIPARFFLVLQAPEIRPWKVRLIFRVTGARLQALFHLRGRRSTSYVFPHAWVEVRPSWEDDLVEVLVKTSKGPRGLFIDFFVDISSATFVWRLLCDALGGSCMNKDLQALVKCLSMKILWDYSRRRRKILIKIL